MLFEPLNAFYREKWGKLSDLERSRQDVPQINIDQVKKYGTATQIVAKLAKQVDFGRATGHGEYGSIGICLVAVYDNRDKEASIMETDGWFE
jgi:hypothetical protein